MSLNTSHIGAKLPELTKGAHSRRLDLITVVAVFGGILFGYDTGVVNGALAPLSRDLGLNPALEGLVTSTLLVGAAIGAVFGGRTADRFGRRRNLIGLAVLFFVGTLGVVFAPNIEVLLVFRFILGLGVGGASVTVPVYLAELSPTELRGQITGRNEVAVVFAQFLAFVINAIIGNIWGEQEGIWRYMLAVAAIPAVLLFFGMLRMPESPRWLLTRGREAEALAVLMQVRTEDRARAEIEEVRELAAEEAAAGHGSFRDLKVGWVRRLVIIGSIFAAIQQLTGINAVVYYGSQLLANAGFSVNASLVANVAVGVLLVVGMVVGVRLSGKINRKTMLVFGMAAITVMHLAVALVALLAPPGVGRAITVMILVAVFVGIMAGTLGLLMWVVLAEMFPLRLRGFAIGLAVFWNWIVNAAISFVFPILLAAIGINGTFFAFAAVGLLSTLFLAKYVPETRGRSLEQLQEDFSTGNFRSPVTRRPVETRK